MKPQHTPGPWTFEPCHTEEGTRYHHIRSGPTGVADTYHFDPITVMGYGPMAGHIPHRHSNPADAILIAAAPDLLAACEALIASAHPHPTEHPSMFRAWEIGRAAIAKAGDQDPKRFEVISSVADAPVDRSWFVWEAECQEEGATVVLARTKAEAEMRVRCDWSRPHQPLLRETELVVVEATAEQLAERAKLDAEEDALDEESDARRTVVEVAACVDPGCPTNVAGVASAHWHQPRVKCVPARAVGQ